VANKSFYGITAHFIDSNWELQSIVLDFIPFNGKHTQEKIAPVFYKSLKFFENKCERITVVMQLRIHDYGRTIGSYERK